MKKVVGPAAARLRDTPALMPCTAADITVTTNTPTAMPRIVRPARTLFVRIASKAMTTPSSELIERVAEAAHHERFLIRCAWRGSDRAATRGSPDTRRR